MQTLCILGCAGFIGSHLLNRVLSTTDHRVIGIDRTPAKIADILANPRLTYLNLDINGDTATVRDAVNASDIVVSLAALCNPALYNKIPLQVIESNFTAPLQIVKMCSDAHRWLIHFSTCEIYGKSLAAFAGKNSGAEIFSEDTSPFILGPVQAQRWSYACAKQLLERTMYAYSFEKGLTYTIVRPFNFIGPSMDYIPDMDGEGVPRVIACFMDALLHDNPLQSVDGGKNRRCFTYVDDAIDAVMSMLDRPQASLKPDPQYR